MKKSIGDNMIPAGWTFERGLELAKTAGYEGIELLHAHALIVSPRRCSVDLRFPNPRLFREGRLDRCRPPVIFGAIPPRHPVDEEEEF
jgi:hypothetical protein